MKYTAHLTTGASFGMEFEGNLNLVETNGEFLVDENGVIVKIDAIAALVPVTESTTPIDNPAWVTDGDGDRWDHLEGDLYKCLSASGATMTLAEIGQNYHIRGVASA